MKKLISVCVLLAMLLLCACDVTPANTQQPSDIPTEQPTVQSTEGIDEEMYLVKEKDMYGDGKGINMLVGIDELGRTVAPSGAKKTEKKVGIFYWIWHGTYTDEIIDTSKIIEQYGVEYALTKVHEYNPNMYPHWWGEPLYGYYNSGDEYIIRKHLTLLMYSGVDFIMFDATNMLTYPTTVRKICKIVCEMRAEGFNVPQISYYTHTGSIATVRQAYKEVYSNEDWRDAWYCIDGKPLMVAQTDLQKDITRTRGQHSHLADYDPGELEQELLDFFYFRTPAWCGMDAATNDSWPWIDWNYPAERHGNLMCVSVASHHYTMFSWMYNDPEHRPQEVWNAGRIAWGRGYNVKTGKNVAEDAVKGTFYQSNWDSVFKFNPEIAYISGWNEWCCGNSDYYEKYGTYSFYDSFDMQYSRDAELMKGGFGDNFLVQTAMNARKFNYDEAAELVPALSRTIDINGSLSQWDNVPAKYLCTGSTNYGRDSRGASKTLKYYTPQAVNSIQEVRVASDKDNVYFYIRNDGDIQTGGNKMNLFIGTGTPELKGWNGYEYLLNRTVDGNTTGVEKLSESFDAQSIGTASVNVSGNVMQISIPRALIGLSQNSTLYFKLADSVENTEDIMDYYVTGRCMPMGRFSYQFIGN